MKTDLSTSAPPLADDANGREWLIPDLSVPFSGGPGRSLEDFETYRRVVTEVIEIASAYNWTRKETATRIGMLPSTFSQWVSKKYDGRYDKFNEKAGEWLAGVGDARAIEERIPSPPPFLKLKLSMAMMDTLSAAQIMAEMVVISEGAGYGKSFTCEFYQSVKPHVYMATMSPKTATYTGMLQQIAEDIGITQIPRGQSLISVIGHRIKRVPGGSLLIIDECEHLSNEAFNQARVFLDRFKCGIAFVGNPQANALVMQQWSKDVRYGALHRRVFKNLHVPELYSEDIDTFIRAWGVTAPDIAAELKSIARKPGALGQINKTLRLALMTAQGNAGELTLTGVRKAWENRKVGV